MSKICQKPFVQIENSSLDAWSSLYEDGMLRHRDALEYTKEILSQVKSSFVRHKQDPTFLSVYERQTKPILSLQTKRFLIQHQGCTQSCSFDLQVQGLPYENPKKIERALFACLKAYEPDNTFWEEMNVFLVEKMMERFPKLESIRLSTQIDSSDLIPFTRQATFSKDRIANKDTHSFLFTIPRLQLPHGSEVYDIEVKTTYQEDSSFEQWANFLDIYDLIVRKVLNDTTVFEQSELSSYEENLCAHVSERYPFLKDVEIHISPSSVTPSTGIRENSQQMRERYATA